METRFASPDGNIPPPTSVSMPSDVPVCHSRPVPSIPGPTHRKPMFLGTQGSLASTLGLAGDYKCVTDRFSSLVDPIESLRPDVAPVSPQYQPASTLMHSGASSLNIEPNSAVPCLPISTLTRNAAIQRVNDPFLLHDAPQRVCDSPILASDPDGQTSTCSLPSNTTSSSSWSVEYPRALNEASELSAVLLHTSSLPCRRATTSMYTTNSSTSMNFIENNTTSSLQPDVMHPPCPNRATIQPKNLQEDKSVLTVEDRMAPICEKHHIMEKRRIMLITWA